MTHAAAPRANLRVHLRWCILDPLRARIRDFLQLRCGDAHLADDLSQETFVRALFSGAAVERFDRPDAWLIHVARNVARDHLRRSWSRPARPIDDVLAEDLVASSPPPSALEPEILLEVAGGRYERDRVARVLPRVWRELSLQTVRSSRRAISRAGRQGRRTGARGAPRDRQGLAVPRAGPAADEIERFVTEREILTEPGADVALTSICAEGRDRGGWGVSTPPGGADP